MPVGSTLYVVAFHLQDRLNGGEYAWFVVNDQNSSLRRWWLRSVWKGAFVNLCFQW